MSAAATLLQLASCWGIAGVAVAAAFLLWGIDSIDEDADGAYVFRPLLIPGILLIWPLVLWRWWVLASGRDRWQNRHAPPRDSHRIVAALLALALGGILLSALMARQHWPADFAPERLTAPEEVRP